jgi:hypothetical protein
MFIHQCILAGTYRRLRMRRRAEAREVLRLFDVPMACQLGTAPKWFPELAAFAAATVGANRT